MQTKETIKLVKLAKKQDKDAFTELIKGHMQDMYKVGLAILMNDEDVADAIGDTILACYEKLNTLKEDKYFKTWLTRILINNCYAILDKRKPLTDLEEWEEPSVSDDYNLELKEALSSIDEKYRAVITLYYVEELSTAEIAKLLDIPKSTVTTRLQRGREALAAYYSI
ncbi:MAG: sigma-70 family RNA polymerase sigma factor [Lachnospiraceae bacterium]|nr:sigma-70 family RNA polymerase sigma factor [Lachnospiraceae bacterium]